MNGDKKLGIWLIMSILMNWMSVVLMIEKVLMRMLGWVS